MRVAAALVHYRGLDDTRACLESLRVQSRPPERVWVVDQASDPGAPAAIRAAFPEATVLENAGNTGFAAGANRAAAAALADGADAVLLVNPDAVCDPGMVAALADAAGADPRLGACGPLVVRADDPGTVWSAGGEVDRWGRARHVGEGQPASPGPQREVDYLPGCGLWVSRAAWEATGGFDEALFLYYEDADLCRRIRAAGYGVRLVPEARMAHAGSRSTGRESSLSAYHLTRNRLRFARRHGGIAACAGALADTARVAAAWGRRGDPRAGAAWRAVADFLRGRGGAGPFTSP